MEEIKLRINLKICKHFVLIVTFQSFFYFHFQMSKQGILTIANHDIFSLKLKCGIFHNRSLFANGFTFEENHYFQGWRGKAKAKAFLEDDDILYQ